MVCGQPLYHVSVDPPIKVSPLPPDVVIVTLCFGPADFSFLEPLNLECPLGNISRVSNGPDEPLEQLALGTGSDNIPPSYTEVIEMYMLATRNGQTTHSEVLRRISAPAGELVTVSTTGTVGTITVTFQVDCVPGKDCVQPPIQSLILVLPPAAVTTPTTTDATVATTDATVATTDVTVATADATVATTDATVATTDDTVATTNVTTTTTGSRCTSKLYGWLQQQFGNLYLYLCFGSRY